MIDPETFAIYNRNGLCYLVDKSINVETRIKAVKGNIYRLSFDDFINFGLDVNIHITKCISKNVGTSDELNFINMRWVPEGVSTYLTT